MCLPIQGASFFSDSEVVMWWIRGRGRDFRSFVANRVGEIQANTSPSQWQHVSTAENPADTCRRGASPKQLAEDKTWWEGPEWLKKGIEDWPKMKLKTQPRELSEQKILKEPTAYTTSLVTNVPDVSDCETEPEVAEWKLKPERFSDWSRLVRLLARAKRVVFNMRNADQRRGRRELTADEINKAESDVIRNAQREALSEDYRLVKAGKTCDFDKSACQVKPQD